MCSRSEIDRTKGGERKGGNEVRNTMQFKCTPGEDEVILAGGGTHEKGNSMKERAAMKKVFETKGGGGKGKKDHWDGTFESSSRSCVRQGNPRQSPFQDRSPQGKE